MKITDADVAHDEQLARMIQMEEYMSAREHLSNHH